MVNMEKYLFWSYFSLIKIGVGKLRYTVFFSGKNILRVATDQIRATFLVGVQMWKSFVLSGPKHFNFMK